MAGLREEEGKKEYEMDSFADLKQAVSNGIVLPELTKLTVPVLFTPIELKDMAEQI